MGATTQNYNSLVSIDVAEAMALLYGLRFTADIGVGPIGIESDFSSIFSAINFRSLPRSDVGLVLADIYHSFSFVSVSHMRFASRRCNIVAHSLARFSLLVSEPLSWLEESPPCVAALVSTEVVTPPDPTRPDRPRERYTVFQYFLNSFYTFQIVVSPSIDFQNIRKPNSLTI
ncbi:hypothetical protein ACOSP7_032935 [Xanthoceras sorbifolium]